ncbi:glutamate synthase [NADH] [Puccinia graminis f. sp. tritici]|uniref:glutamate synthase (ferredoxin) n=1 Tax=Puccinia graminis f. sp. tritici TaxID=56615 RepID=A0A5B0SFK9_PUCGR|nr:glutamate synthase [NADH] [Puccinia graminis f. sp. tritici]
MKELRIHEQKETGMGDGLERMVEWEHRAAHFTQGFSSLTDSAFGGLHGLPTFSQEEEVLVLSRPSQMASCKRKYVLGKLSGSSGSVLSTLASSRDFCWPGAGPVAFPKRMMASRDCFFTFLLTQSQQSAFTPRSKKKKRISSIDPSGLVMAPKVHNNQEQKEIKSSEPDSNLIRSSNHWAGALPAPQGLYDPDQEKDSCGVGFVCHIKGQPNHKIVSDARSLLCNMTHRGATGADARDGDGAGVMTGIPHAFFLREASLLSIDLPAQGRYAVGNVFFRPNPPEALIEHKATFERIALTHKLKVLGWRELPRNNSILGPAALSREPIILQPFVVPDSNEPDAYFDEKEFERQLYVLRKHASHAISLADWFYICSLSNKVIIYKGQLSPSQVYEYYYDLNHVLFESHFCLVHSRFSTNTFPSWDRAQPLRWAAHNGEVNTVRGNKNWMRAREGNLSSDKFGDQLESLYPIIEEGGSDSAAFDNVLELLVVNGVMSLPYVPLHTLSLSHIILTDTLPSLSTEKPS